MANKMKNSFGSGDMANENTPGRVMDIATMGKERMNSYAKGGGLMGMMNGGDVMEPMSYGNGGGTKKGMKRKTARRAYTS